MKNKCLCRSCKNQNKLGYCCKLKDFCSKHCSECKGMNDCYLHERNKAED